MKLLVLPALGLMLAGCQLVAQGPGLSPAVPPAPSAAVPISSPAPQAAFVILPKAGADGTQHYEIRSLATGKDLHGWPLDREIRAFSRLSAKNGGPTYSVVPTPAPAPRLTAVVDPKDCVVDPELRRALKAKEPVCYTTEDAGSIAVYTLPR